MTNKEDLISREYVKEAIADLVVGGEERIKEVGEGIEWVNGIYSAYREINNAPTVKERPTGEWIEHYDCQDGFTWLTCSRCMFKAYEEGYTYCPNCGAEMRGTEE